MLTGSNPGPLHGAMAQADVMRTRVGAVHVPASVIAAVREERQLQRLKRRIALLSRLGLIR